MTKKVFITGLTGFAGSHLADYLIAKNEYEIVGTYLSEKSLVNVAHVKDKLKLIQVDLQKSTDINTIIKEEKPDLVFHLAAIPNVGSSFNNPSESIINNITVQMNLLEAIKDANINPRILIVSSADVYGKVDKSDLPIDEETPFNPTNTYAVSKIAQDYLGLQYFNSYKLPIIRARPFNHIGPRQAQGFVVSDLSAQIVAIEKGKSEPVIKVGNIETKRDFTDVRDTVIGYQLILEKGEIGDVYNLGSGISYKISDILEKLLAHSKTKITIMQDAKLFRPSDTPDLVCDNSKVTAKTGWKPGIPIEKTLEDSLEYWRDIAI